SSVLLVVSACSSTTSPDLLNQEQIINAQSQSKDSIYPFDINKDFYPLYNSTQWKYDVYTTENNKLITSMTKTLDVSNEASLELDKKNNYYIVALKKSYSDPNIKDPQTYEFIRRRNNQLAFGKFDDLTYYPSKQNSISKDFDPYNFRAYSDFNSGKLETVKVKAGTFQCIKSEFTLKMDTYTIWYAKGVGEVKRIKQGYTNGFRYELSEYNSSAKQFVLAKETMTLKDLPSDLQTKVNTLKDEFIKINELPNDLFTMKTSNTIFVENKVVKDNYKKQYEISFTNRSLSSKDNVTLIIDCLIDGTVKNVTVVGENNTKATYKGKTIEKLPLIKK
ncbi:MAG: hypothetical protein U0354_13870, partial [Candidatus Sericytochromatia bacterium]